MSDSSWLYDIPPNWGVGRIGDHVEIINGFPFDSALFHPSKGMPLIRIRDIASITTEVRYGGTPITEAIIDKGDILIGMDGDFNVERWRGEKALLNQRVCCLRPGNIVDSRYIFYFLPSPLKTINDLIYSTTVKHLSSLDIAKIRFPFPPLPEQRAIADYLDRETSKIDSLITEKERLLSLLAEKRRALINNAVSYGLSSIPSLRRVDIPWLDAIPKHWEVLRGKYLFSRSSIPVRDGDEIVTCFRDGQVTLRRNRREEGFTNAIQELGYQGIRVGQLVLHSMDAFAGAIGVSDSDGKCSPEYIICNPTSEKVLNLYYGDLLRIMALQGFIQASCSAVRERAPRIHFSDLANMLFPVPPIEEQKKIVVYVASKTKGISSLQKAATTAVELLRERRTALISAAVTGQIRLGAES